MWGGIPSHFPRTLGQGVGQTTLALIQTKFTFWHILWISKRAIFGNCTGEVCTFLGKHTCTETFWHGFRCRHALHGVCGGSDKLIFSSDKLIFEFCGLESTVQTNFRIPTHFLTKQFQSKSDSNQIRPGGNSGSDKLSRTQAGSPGRGTVSGRIFLCGHTFRLRICLKVCLICA